MAHPIINMSDTDGGLITMYSACSPQTWASFQKQMHLSEAEDSASICWHWPSQAVQQTFWYDAEEKAVLNSLRGSAKQQVSHTCIIKLLAVASFTMADRTARQMNTCSCSIISSSALVSQRRCLLAPLSTKAGRVHEHG